MNELRAEQVTGPWAYHGEGPVWDHAAGVLRWMDMLDGDVLSWRPGDERPIRWDVGEVAGALRRRRDGGFVVAVARGFQLLADDGSFDGSIPPLWEDRTLRMNEGACSPSGRFYCGSMAYDAEAGRGAMHVLDPDGTARTLFGGLTISNGMAFSPDGEIAYHIDSPTQCVKRYDVQEDGSLVAPSVLFDVPPELGKPDGMTMDSDGNFWIALWGGSTVRQYSPVGEVMTTVHVAASQVTACSFGGIDGRDLYITTSREDLEGEPAAGSVFRVRTDAVGRGEELFAG
jgi:sugar lactone lactonase YvrE